ncbi:hypothetical protein I4U23_001925 [Adineta vaga]|nr:hypothetical protein I4U23_001925 [Adineta vaga]
MYAPPPAVAPGGAGRSGLAASGPILAICCLLFILFLIASTIVLALIPVYLSTRDITATGKSPSYLLTADPTAITDTSGKRADYSSFDADQELDSDSRTNTANAVISKLSLSSGAFLVDQCRTAYTTSRKRRGFGILREARATNGVKLFCKVRFNYAKCGRCVSTSYLQSISTFFFTATQSIKISGESSVPKRIFTYSCKLTLSDAGYPTSTSGFTGAVSG